MQSRGNGPLPAAFGDAVARHRHGGTLSRRTAARTVAATLGLVLTLAACTTTSSGGTSGTSASSSGGGNSVPEAVKSKLAPLVAVPSLESPGAAVPVSTLKGKTVFVIPLQSTNQYNNLIDSAMQDAGAKAGVKVTIYTNQGQTNQWVAGMNQAVSQHVGAIVLSGGTDPRALQPQIKAARDAGIPVIVSQFFDNSAQYDCGKLSADCIADIDGVIPTPYQDSSAADADWIIQDSNAKANILVVTSNDAGPSKGQADAVKKEVDTNCPACKVKFVDVPVAQWTTGTQSTVQSALVSDPTINYVLPLYDVMAAQAAAAVTSSGRSAKVVTFNGTPSVLTLIQSGKVVAMDIGQNLAQIGYANMDQSFRLMAKMPASKTERDVIRAFDKSNVNDAGTPPQQDKGFGNGYLDNYLKLWGLS
jgi:ribose transport system substrate-binding protein